MQIQNDKKYGAVSFEAGQFNWISFFCDPGGEGKTPNRLRVAPFSAATHGFTTFPGEIFRAPRSWVELGYPNLTYFHEADRGGHFAAWEEPELFATEIRAAFRSLR